MITAKWFLGLSEIERVEAVSSMNFVGNKICMETLRSAGYSASDLRRKEDEAKLDIQEKSKKMGKTESEFIIYTLKKGLMNGSSYGTIKSCGCFLGSAAKSAKMSVEDFCKKKRIKKDVSSPAEQWFLAVNIGDTPEDNYAAKKAVEWIEEAIDFKA